MNPREIAKINANRKEKINLNGETKLLDVYKVDISTLFYNDENGRIATFMAEYKAKHGSELKDLSFDEYNDVIMNFVKKSGNAEKYKITKEDIRSNGQMKTGIILSDGRVIDGNRRFTCLRELYEETKDEKYKYFECIILDVPTSVAEIKAVKALELRYQFGEDQREDYNPIDKLVDIYNCLVGPNKMFTVDEYLNRVNNQIKKSELNMRITKAIILYDFLDYIGKPKRFDYARDMKLDGPIQELAGLRKMISDDDEWNRVKPALYSQMNKLTGDRSRNMRELIKIYKNSKPEFDAILSRIIEEEFDSGNNITPNNYLPNDNNQLAEKKSVDTLIHEASSGVGLNLAQRKQNEILKATIKKISEIDKTALMYLPSDYKDEFINDLEELKNKIELLEKSIKGNANQL